MNEEPWISPKDIADALGNGWHCHAISTMTPGIIRVQLGDNGLFSDMGYRTSVEAETFDGLLKALKAFCAASTPEAYFRRKLR